MICPPLDPAPRLAVRAVVLGAYPLLLFSLLLLWAHYSLRHTWTSSGLAVGFGPEDGWATGGKEDRWHNHRSRNARTVNFFNR